MKMDRFPKKNFFIEKSICCCVWNGASDQWKILNNIRDLSHPEKILYLTLPLTNGSNRKYSAVPTSISFTVGTRWPSVAGP